MKIYLMLLMLALTSLTVYAAPINTPLHEFKGGPRYEQNDPIKQKEVIDSETCKLMAKPEVLKDFSKLLEPSYSLNKQGFYSTCQWV